MRHIDELTLEVRPAGGELGKVKVTVYTDAAALANALVFKALANASGRAVLAGGAVIVEAERKP